MTDSARPLRILYVTHAYKPAYRLGGPVLSVSGAAEALVARGHEVVVYTTNCNLDQDLAVPLGQAVTVDGVEVWYFERSEPLKRWFPSIKYVSQSMGFLYSPSLATAVRNRVCNFDLVHTQMPFVHPTLAAGRAACRAGKPLFYSQRGVFDPQRLRYRGLKKRLYIWAVERPLMKKATTIIALTENERVSYRALGVGTPCAVVGNGIDVRSYRQRPSGDPGGSLGIPAESRVVLFLGRLHPTKGADLLCDAFLRIGKALPGAVLVMAGPDELAMTKRLKRRAAEAGLADRILFPGMVGGGSKLDLLARADLFCLPSIAEGFSIAVLEALASGTPVILSPGCHFPEIEAAGAGWVVERSVDAWASAIEFALSEPARLEQMGGAGLGFVRRCFTWPSVAEQLEETYHEGMNRPSRHS